MFKLLYVTEISNVEKNDDDEPHAYNEIDHHDTSHIGSNVSER